MFDTGRRDSSTGNRIPRVRASFTLFIIVVLVMNNEAHTKRVLIDEWGKI